MTVDAKTTQPDHRQSIETPYGWAVLAVSLLLVVVGYGSTLLLLVSLKQIAVDLEWPRSVPSRAYACNMIGIGLGGIVMGYWSDRSGPAPAIVLSALAMPAGLWLASNVTEPWQVYLAYGLLIGFIANGALFSPLIANTTRWFDKRRGLAIAIVASGQGVGGTLLAPLFRWVNEHHGWRTTYEWYALVALCLMVPTLLILRRRAPQPHQNTAVLADNRQPLGMPLNTVHAMLFAAIICCCVAMATPLVHLVAHVSDLGFTYAQGAQVLSLLLFTSLFSRLGLGALSDRIGGFRTLLSGSGLQAISLLLFASLGDLWAIYGIAVLFGLGFGGIVPSYAMIIREIFPERRAAWRIAMVMTGGTLGMASGGYAGGWIFDGTGSYVAAFLLGFAFNLGNLAIIGNLYRRHRRGRRMDVAVPA
jgi:MFS family permease